MTISADRTGHNAHRGPETWTDADEAWSESVAQHAGCPRHDCPDATLCDGCGEAVCETHTRGAVRCVEEPSTHHAGCSADCVFCIDAVAREVDRERATAGRC